MDLVVVVDNLVDNARKHGAQNMRLSARGRKGGDLVDVLVTDDGRGLDERRVDPARIFDKGYTSTRGGTGLGLYHARKGHGGDERRIATGSGPRTGSRKFRDHVAE